MRVGRCELKEVAGSRTVNKFIVMTDEQVGEQGKIRQMPRLVEAVRHVWGAETGESGELVSRTDVCVPPLGR